MYADDRSLTVIGILFPVLCLILLALRFIGWRRYADGISIDDVLMLPAAILNIATGIMMVIGAQLHVRSDHVLTSGQMTPEEVKFGFAFWILHFLAIGFIKLTILFFLRRIFKGPVYMTTFDYSNWILIIAVTAWTLVFTFLAIFSYNPPSSNRPDNSPFYFSGITLTSAVTSWILDIAILVEPLVVIFTLRHRLFWKLRLSALFLISFFAVIAGLLNMVVWIQIQLSIPDEALGPQSLMLLGSATTTANTTQIIIVVGFWTYIEIGLGFLVACLPTCAKVLEDLGRAVKVVIVSLMKDSTLVSRCFGTETPPHEESDQDVPSSSSFSCELAEKPFRKYRHGSGHTGESDTNSSDGDTLHVPIDMT